MNLSEKREEILEYLEISGYIGLGDACLMIGSNDASHVRKVLYGMVKDGIIRNIRNGMWEMVDPACGCGGDR